MVVPAFFIRQRITMMINRYEVLAANPDGTEGQLLALADNTGNSTGNHLHFGHRPRGYDPNNGFFGWVNPLPFLPYRRRVLLQAGHVGDGSGAPREAEWTRKLADALSARLALAGVLVGVIGGFYNRPLPADAAAQLAADWDLCVALHYDGQEGVALQRLGRGLDPRPLVPDPGVRRFVERIELEWPIEELEPLSFVFARLLDPLEAALEQADRAGEDEQGQQRQHREDGSRRCRRSARARYRDLQAEELSRDAGAAVPGRRARREGAVPAAFRGRFDSVRDLRRQGADLRRPVTSTAPDRRRCT